MKRNPDDPVTKDASNPTTFGPPMISPQVADPRAQRYAARLAENQQAKQARYATPVGGGAMPPIPRLDMPADPGLTMSDQANLQRMGPPPGPAALGSMFQEAPASPPQVAATGRLPLPNQQRPGLLPIDILPEEARQDPEFREGHGSMYASAQPHLAAKYGVIRNSQRIPPQQLGQAKPGLSQKTVAGLEEMQNTTRRMQQADTHIEQQAAAGPAGSAGRLGNAPTDGPAANAQASQKNLTEAVKKLDDFDFSTFREMLMKDIINNDDQREIIEPRCTPLELGDLVMKGYVIQRVPIIPGKFEPSYQSFTGEEDLAVKRLIALEAKSVEVSDRYLLDKYSFMNLTLGVYAINGTTAPTHRDAEGKFNEEAFWKKFEWVSRLPFHMLSSLGVNFFWFDIRVRKLFVAERLGNG